MKQVLFVYTGYEQGTWGDIAFRREKYYHYLPGIVYLATAVNGDPGLAGRYAARTRHYNTSVQSEEQIAAEILEARPDVLGLGCYCWNIDLHLRLARRVREALPGVRIVLGGPEISMRDRRECAAFFERHPWVDLLVFGEAELKICRLVDAVAGGDHGLFEGADGYALNPRLGPHAEPAIAQASALSLVPSIYPHEIRVERSPGCGLHVVYECSRGCPNRCIYCEFVRRRNRQEDFELDRIERELAWLLEQQVDGIHFADAVFDREPAFAKRILRHFKAHQRRSTLLLYCSFNALDAELADLLEQTQCQVDVGVQTTSREVLRTLQRAGSRRLFQEAPALLRAREVNFYTDLMFGLPDDTMQSFKRSFDGTMRLDPKFFMLFPLSLIKGTALGDDPGRYNVVPYDAAALEGLDLQCAIEYRNVGLHRSFTLVDLESFDSAALTCFYYYNRFPHSLGHLRKRFAGNLFDLFEQLGRATKDYIRRTGRRPTNTDYEEGFHDEIRQMFRDALAGMGAGPLELGAFEGLFKIDVMRFLVMHSPQREKIFSQSPRPGAGAQSDEGFGDRTRLVKSTWGKTIALDHPFTDLRRLHELGEEIVPSRAQVFVHAPFERADAGVFDVTEEQSFVISFLPTGQGLRYRALATAYHSQFGRKGRVPADLAAVVGTLVDAHVVRVLGE